MHATRTAVVLFTISSALTSAASAEDYVTTSAPPGSTTRGKSFSRDLDQFIGGLLRTCVADNPARARATLDEWTADLTKLTDAAERDMFSKYLASARKLVEAHLAGIPGRGSYAELTATYEKEKAAYDSAFPTAVPTTTAETEAAVAGLLDYRARSERYIQQYRDMSKESLCVHRAGKWAELAKASEQAELRIQKFTYDIVPRLLEQLNAWHPKARILDEPIPTEYWAHAKYTDEVIQLALLTEKIAPLAGSITAWAPLYTGDKDKAVLATASADVAKVQARVGPLAAKLLAEVRPPKLRPRAEHAAKIKKGRKVLGPIVGGTGYSNQPTTGADPQDGRRYSFNRRYYSTYYVRKPDGDGPAELPALPGIARKDVCELWHQSLYTYTAGGPSVRPLNTWRFFQDWRVSYVLCKHASTPTRMNMKK